jgi:hypothetical protein
MTFALDHDIRVDVPIPGAWDPACNAVELWRLLNAAAIERRDARNVAFIAYLMARLGLVLS